MKFLLVAINSKYIHSNLAVYSLKAYAQKYGQNHNQIEIAEYTINQYSDEIIQDIYERHADAIGFSCYIWNIKMIKEIAGDYKKISPDTQIWAGGPEVSYNIRAFLTENSSIDYIMYMEGEKTFQSIMDAYTDQHIDTSELKNINGIAYRENGIIIQKPQQPVVLSDIPFAYEDIKEFENRIVYYESSRGCPFSCSYCLSSIDKTLRFRDLKLVKQELKYFLDHKVAQVKFVDRTFNCKREHAMEIWKFIKEHDNGVTNFHFEIAADLITDEDIALFRTMRQGLIQLEIGVQSVNHKTLEAIHRKTDIKKIARVTGQIREGNNIHQHLDLIAGLPYENYQSFSKSFNEVYAMQPDQLQLGFLKVLHGSIMENDTKKYDIVYSQRPPYEVIRTKWISYGELLKLKNIEAVVEIYYNSLQFTNTMRCLGHQFLSAFEMYEQLGDFYKSKSPKGEKHSRVTRYNILLDFCKQHSDKKQSASMGELTNLKYEELLTLDFYLRENAKTRPAFSPDISAYKKKLQKFYQTPELICLLPDYKKYNSRQIEKMTHMEIFGIGTEQETYILFDYKNRNRLNHQAKIINVTDMIKEI